MKAILFFLLCIIAGSVSASEYAAVGASYREGSAHLAAGYMVKLKGAKVGAEISLTDCGKQPAPHDNINRMLGLSLVAQSPLSENVSLLSQFGINSTRYSHNGENDYRANQGFHGYQGGIGLTYSVSKNISVYLLGTAFQYQQANNPHMGGYTTAMIGIRGENNGD